MRFFLKRVVKWLLFLLFTVFFFAIPVILQEETRPMLKNNPTQLQTLRREDQDQKQSDVYFEFEAESVKEKLLGDSTALRIDTRSDTSEKYVYLYVNGEKQDVAIVSGSMRIDFPRVYLKPGRNEITAVLQRLPAETLAVRRATIFSLKKM